MLHQQLQFKNGNPGAVQFGNFINYYEFNPPTHRIKLLPPINNWLASIESLSIPTNDPTFLALDIGCNAGNLTHGLKDYLQKHLPPHTNLQVLAIDIDPVLIERAKEQYPSKNIQFVCCDSTTDEFNTLVQNFLSTYKRSVFNAIFCFSTTMWIHLNHGDHGLQQFFRHICGLCDMFVVEPQPWKCYTKAVKRMKKMIEFPHLKNLKMCYNVVEDIEVFLTNELNMHKVFESTLTEWKRKIFVFKHV